MIALCIVSIVFGLFWLDTARTAFDCDEPGAGFLAALCGTVFLLLGLKGLA